MAFWDQFSSQNLGYLVEQYGKFRENPDSVDAQMAALFEQHGPPAQNESAPDGRRDIRPETYVAAANLAQAIRTRGFLAAELDPLKSPPPGDPSLELAHHNLTEKDLRAVPAGFIKDFPPGEFENALQAIRALRATYSDAIGFDYGHIRQADERDWLRNAAESRRFAPEGDRFDPEDLLNRLTEVAAFEHFLHRMFPGKTRFSIEGLDMLVPMLDELVSGAAENDLCTILLGMAHRGRLNILAHILGKPYREILAEFKDPLSRFQTWDEMGWTGDVKYHKGAERPVEDTDTIELVIRLPANPSHLEHINPVIMGMARSASSRAGDAGIPDLSTDAALPLLIHGDAAFSGEGVVAETLNLSQLPGYRIGGTIHILANNQLGFTTEPDELRSSQFASDLAKGFEIPVIHVNADRPRACLEAARTALAYRQKFRKDFLIDLIGYRRYGHNEGDEPAFTQPEMYSKIADHPSVREIWAEHCVAQGFFPEDAPARLIQQAMEELQEVNEGLEEESALREPHPKPPPSGAAQRVETAIPLNRLQSLNETLLQMPEDLNLHPKLAKGIERRKEIFENRDEKSIDWATAEELALASLLQEGVSVRFTGEDVVRGTFSQRHAVFYDTEEPERTITPLARIPDGNCFFEIHNSPLTENATIGFEFGYNIQSPNRLVVWEAQYGDFINVAQTMVDEFVTSARAKWGQTPSLVLLLPHGNEGQGPDHSSGRLERFLQLAADTNMRIANPTTAGQYFHLLRRQGLLLETDPLPLIVFTPKGLLRHPRTAITPDALSEGTWRPVIDAPRPDLADERIERLLLCSGRIHVDLASAEKPEENDDLTIVRVEQLYPFPRTHLEKVFNRYPNLKEVDWVQEEPQNMGAWSFLQPRLKELLQGDTVLHYIGRPPSASPAEGSTQWYRTTQQALIQQAFSHSSAGEVIDSDVIKEKIDR